MHPEDIEVLKAPAPARIVFRFLHETARPDADFIACMSRQSGSRAGSLISSFSGTSIGLLVLEVKDWLIDQIEEADSHSFKIFLNRPFPAVT